MTQMVRKPPGKMVLASGNKGKLAELADALAPLGTELFPLSDFTDTEADENADSFEGNALLKARHAAAVSGLPALADDSGLEVEALNWAPGIYSARYAGEHGNDAANNEKLLRALGGVKNRNARFRCVIAYVESENDSNPLICDGRWDGEILQEPRGEQGFGYDPLFFDPRLGLASAELAREVKREHSHRGQAVKLFIEALSAG